MPALNLPELSQWTPGAARYRNDCGPASVAMCLAYYGKLGSLTIDDLASETGLRYSDSGLLPIQLAVLASKHGLAGHVHDHTTEDELKAEIIAGRPVILLLAYRWILNRLDQADRIVGEDGHYVTLVGFDDSHWVINDSDYWVPYVERGHNYPVPVTELKRAMDEYHGQTVMIGQVIMTPKEQVKALLAQAAAVIDTIDETPTAPAEPVTKYATIDNLNLRGGAGTSYPILRKLALSEAVTVVSSAGQWDRVSAPLAGYVFNPSLSVVRPI